MSYVERYFGKNPMRTLHFFPHDQGMGPQTVLSFELLKTKCDALLGSLTILEFIIDNESALFISQAIQSKKFFFLDLYACEITWEGFNHLLHALNTKTSKIQFLFNETCITHTSPLPLKDFFRGETKYHDEFVKSASEMENDSGETFDKLRVAWECKPNVHNNIKLSTEMYVPALMRLQTHAKRPSPIAHEEPPKLPRTH